MAFVGCTPASPHSPSDTLTTGLLGSWILVFPPELVPSSWSWWFGMAEVMSHRGPGQVAGYGFLRLRPGAPHLAWVLPSVSLREVVSAERARGFGCCLEE